MFKSTPNLQLDIFFSTVTSLLRRTIGRIFWMERIAFYGSDIEVNSIHQHHPAGMSFVAPTADELVTKYALQLDANFCVDAEKIRQRLSRSHCTVLAVCDNTVVAMLWLAFTEQEVSEIGRRILVLQPHEVLTYDEATLPAWRGKGISPALNKFADAFAAQRKALRRITWRRVSNAPAIRVAEKLGDTRIAVATTIRIANRWHPIVLGLDAGSGLTFRRQ